MAVTEVDRAYCRAAARECVQQALFVVDVDKKAILLARAQDWLRLAYANSDAELERLLAEFNQRQLAIEGDAQPIRPPDAHPQMQQQQQQKAKKSEGK
jgi:inorganic triphosphatase YgiF